jgi:hypothetical protein
MGTDKNRRSNRGCPPLSATSEGSANPIRASAAYTLVSILWCLARATTCRRFVYQRSSTRCANTHTVTATVCTNPAPTGTVRRPKGNRRQLYRGTKLSGAAPLRVRILSATTYAKLSGAAPLRVRNLSASTYVVTALTHRVHLAWAMHGTPTPKYLATAYLCDVAMVIVSL